MIIKFGFSENTLYASVSILQVGYDVAVTGKVREKNKMSAPSNLNFESVESD